jgi:AcrR family transcriptional regulator
MTSGRTYHHGDLRNALVTAALDLIREKGIAGLSVAEAARRAGVSGAAPYRHFASRTELLSAAATRLAHELIEQLEASQADLTHDADDRISSIETLAELTRKRIEISFARGAGLELVYAEELRDYDDPERREATRRLFDLYLWPAMTITGDAASARCLLRQAAALAQGYLGIARSQQGTSAAYAAELAEEAAAAVRTLALAATRATP